MSTLGVSSFSESCKSCDYDLTNPFLSERDFLTEAENCLRRQRQLARHHHPQLKSPQAILGPGVAANLEIQEIDTLPGFENSPEIRTDTP